MRKRKDAGARDVGAHPILVAFLGLAAAARAQIVTENAGAQSPELPLLHEQLRVLETENVTEVRLLSQLVYSFTPAFEARLTVPAVWRDLEAATPAGTLDGDLAGPGDAALRLKHSIRQEDDVMSSTRWAALAEGVFPTGAHHEEIDGVEAPRKLQPGLGSFGAGLGTAFTVIRDRHRFSAEVFARHRTRHDGFRAGDSLDVNLAYWYRLAPAEFAEAVAETEVRGVLEVLSTFQDDSHGAPGGGVSAVWVAPGVQLYAGRRVLLEAFVQLPVWQDADDPFGDRRWAAGVGVKFLF